MSNQNQSARNAILANFGNLRDLAKRYSNGCWNNWKAGKTNALNNPAKAFIGGPGLLLEKGIAEVEGADGKPIKISALTRIRVRQVSENGLAQLSALGVKDLTKGGFDPGEDIIHQEYVETYEENIANSVEHLMNNFLAAAAVLDGYIGFVLKDSTTVGEVITQVQNLLEGKDPSLASYLTSLSRAAWIGRACKDGSWVSSADFVLYNTLGQNAAELDAYVVVPVLEQFVADLRSTKS